MIRSPLLYSLISTSVFLFSPVTTIYAAERETQCTDGIDNDNDSVVDCGDADCASDPACKPSGSREDDDRTCSDWIDNDGDGATDCDDRECVSANVTICKGSWDQRMNRANQGVTPMVSTTNTSGSVNTAPSVPSGKSSEDLVGVGEDIDGERNDLFCSDGIDNDNDGKVDCADFGCRFDPAVNICRGDLGIRFSVVARAEAGYRYQQLGSDPSKDGLDARFSVLQLRAFGPLPYLQDSFFLISMRVEKTPRVSFVMFQIPLGKRGHYINVNSGGGGLSSALIRSAHKQLVQEPAYYVFNAFEQGNGGALEIGGPIDRNGRFTFRAFGAGGTGRFSGNVGGTFVSDDNENFTYSMGAQILTNVFGYWSRWDNPMPYTIAPLTLALHVGGKYDQRAQERYVAWNGMSVFRWNRFVMIGEYYGKRELEFGSWQNAYNIQAGVLLLPKWLVLAGDFGEFLASTMDNPPAIFGSDLRKQRQETQWRVALHFFFWRNIGMLSAMYLDRGVDPPPGSTETKDTVEREFKFLVQYYF